jgi:hypothetical protein
MKRGVMEGRSHLQRGDLVVVRSAREILQTLDAEGALEAMPFMPEMVPYCGRRFRVDKRTEKLCDTLGGGCRRLYHSVLLEDLRCDGSGHDDCQAECRLYWKEAWLKKVDPRSPDTGPDPDEAGRAALLERLSRGTRQGQNGKTRYRCQSTALVGATERLSTADPVSYLREYTCGNVGIGEFTRVMTRAVWMEPRAKLKLLKEPPVTGKAATAPQIEPLGLQPGEWVQVKSVEEIQATLNDKGRNRGLYFDREMVPFCGKTFRVRKRIARFVDERSREMIRLKNDCVTLEGAICSGEWSLARWFCPRAIFPYWRECWLKRVPAPGTT